jgi:hypothetical protein
MLSRVNPEVARLNQLQNHLDGQEPHHIPAKPKNCLGLPKKSKKSEYRKMEIGQIFGHCWVNPDVARPNSITIPSGWTWGLNPLTAKRPRPPLSPKNQNPLFKILKNPNKIYFNNINYKIICIPKTFDRSN